jgi:hypothetical protein
LGEENLNDYLEDQSGVLAKKEDIGFTMKVIEIR